MTRVAIVLVTSVLLVCASQALDAQSVQRGRLTVTVVDQTGGVLPTARVTVTGEEDSTRAVAIDPLETNNSGVAVFEAIAYGRYVIQAEFPGFETVVRSVRVRGENTRQQITLPLERLNESLTVGRDGRTSGLDPRGDAFSTILTREQIEALPDDPEELAAVLKAMSPPGAVIRVDGFTGGLLPPKAQIRSIRLPRMDNFAAQNHGGLGGALFIDIMTQPGLGPFRMSADLGFRGDVLTARNPFTPVEGDEQIRRSGFNASGTIVPQRSSFSANVSFTNQDDTVNLLAALPDGTTAATSVPRPLDSSMLNIAFDQALSATHAFRANYQRMGSEQNHLGIGGYDLLARGYTSRTSQNVLRLSENGPIGDRFFSETRLQLSWQSQESISDIEAPTIQVLDSFTSGGAQRRGGRDTTAFQFASDLDYVRGNHSLRTGFLVEGGWYHTDQMSNYFGTYTFASLEDYEAGRPRTFTRRTGDPDVRYSNVQAGLYVQDDWRVARSLLVAYGVRYEVQTHMDQKLNLSPRVSASWSPFRAGHTTLRVSTGYFYDWLDPTTFEQSLVVDGVRLREVQILNPSYPDPGLGGYVPPTNQYLLDPNRRLTTSLAVSTGVDRSFGTRARVSLGYTWRDNGNILAGHNLNAPDDGVRPDDRLANIVESRSVGESRSHSINVGGSYTALQQRRTFLSANYTWTLSEANSTSAFALPASNNLATEWGRVGPRHRMSASFNTQLVTDLGLSLTVLGQSGTPYNVTTGADNDGDGVFVDRPEGLGRNAAQGASHWTVNGRLTYSMGFGDRPASTGEGMGGQVVSIGSGGAGGGFGGGATNKRVRLDFYVSATNLLNRSNFIGYSGVMTSPFFGQPTNVVGPRRIELGVRVAL